MKNAGDEMRAQPNDRLAEQHVLGAMLSSADAADRGLAALCAEDFYHPDHRLIFEIIRGQSEDRKPTEMASVHSALLHRGLLQRAGGAAYLAQLLAWAATPSQVEWFARELTTLALRRRLMDVGTRITQRAYQPSEDTSEDLCAWAMDELHAAANGVNREDHDTVLTAEDLMQPIPAYDWVIPWVLERGDRLIITGGEGGGKSTLGRQLAVMTAAGMHPFSQEPMPSKRVMVVDCENPMKLTMRRYQPLLHAGGAEAEKNIRLYLEHSVDLTHRTDVATLLRRVEKHAPDLLLIGPLYRLHAGDPNDERDARRVALALDKVRAEFGCAIVMETHSPHSQNGQRRTLRPVGSSLWLRWPEFGYGIQPVDDEVSRQFRVSRLVPWRGGRDERNFPRQIRQGRPWPWVVDGQWSAPGRACVPL